MNRQKVTLGAVLIGLLIAGYAVLLWRARPSEQAIETQFNQAKIDRISADIISPAFFAQLRTREVNGELPVRVKPEETFAGEKRNPFVAP